jgi:hypothetical protein
LEYIGVFLGPVKHHSVDDLVLRLDTLVEQAQKLTTVFFFPYEIDRSNRMSVAHAQVRSVRQFFEKLVEMDSIEYKRLLSVVLATELSVAFLNKHGKPL